MLIVLLWGVKNGGGGGIRCLCPLCYAFSKGGIYYPGLFDIDPSVNFDSYAIAYVK